MQRRNLSSLFVLFTPSNKATNRIYKEHSSRANQCQSHILLCIPHVTLLTIITVAFDVLIVLYSRYSSGRSAAYYATQQTSLAALNGYAEESISGLKVVKVFNHEAANLAGFRAVYVALR